MTKRTRVATTHSRRSRIFERPVKITAKGQATLPVRIRRDFDIQAGDRIQFSVQGKRIVLTRIQEIDQSWNAGQTEILTEWDDAEQDIYND